MIKSSFSLIETILSLVILSILIDGFSKFIYIKDDKLISINEIKNSLILNIPNSNITLKTQSTTTYKESIFATNHTINSKIYEDENIKLQYNEPLKNRQIEYKDFE